MHYCGRLQYDYIILGSLLDDQGANIVSSEAIVFGMRSVTIRELLGFPAPEIEFPSTGQKRQ